MELMASDHVMDAPVSFDLGELGARSASRLASSEPSRTGGASSGPFVQSEPIGFEFSDVVQVEQPGGYPGWFDNKSIAGCGKSGGCGGTMSESTPPGMVAVEQNGPSFEEWRALGTNSIGWWNPEGGTHSYRTRMKEMGWPMSCCGGGADDVCISQESQGEAGPWVIIPFIIGAFCSGCSGEPVNRCPNPVPMASLDFWGRVGCRLTRVLTDNDPARQEYCASICCERSSGTIYLTTPARGFLRRIARGPLGSCRPSQCNPGDIKVGGAHSHTHRSGYGPPSRADRTIARDNNRPEYVARRPGVCDRVNRNGTVTPSGSW